MDWQKIKGKTEDHLVGLIFLLITFLCGVVWQAVPSETWTRLGAAIPKRVLAAVIALLLIGLATLTAYVFSLRRQLKSKQAETETSQGELAKLKAAPKRFVRFGVIWDENLQPYCPVHQEIPLGNWLHRMGGIVVKSYYCPASGHY